MPTAAQPGMPHASLPHAAMPAAAPEPLDGPGPEEGEKALPAITIHAFCDRQDTAGVINETTRDWRMKRTNMKIYMGGLPAAIDFYQKEATPALVMVETGMRGPELFTQLAQLAGVCDENTKVVIVGAANDIRLYRQLMEEGVSEYIVPPFHPLSFIRSLSNLYVNPDKPFVGKVVAFYGAKGGVGASTIAHNVAWQVSEHLQSDTALVDLDASFGTSGLDFQYDHSSGLDEALADATRLDEVLLDRIMIRHTPRLSILPASGALGQGVTDREAFEAVVGAVRGVSPLTLLDMPHMWTEWTEAVLSASDEVVIVSTLDLAGLRNTKNIIDHLRSRRPNDPDPILIVNKTGMLDGGITVEEFGAAVGVQPAVSFAFEPDVFVRASDNGEMISDPKLAAGTIEGFQRIASRLKTGHFPVPGTASGGLSLSRLKGAGKGGKKSKDKLPKADADGTESKSFLKKMMKKG